MVFEKLFSLNFSKFVIIGGSATLIDFILYILLSQYSSIEISKLISMLISSFYSYYFNKTFTFSNYDKTTLIYILKFYTVFFVNILINVSVNSISYLYLEDKIFSFIIATSCAMVVNYLLQKYFVFR